MATPYPPACTAASTALGYVLAALDIDGSRDLQYIDGLPDGLTLPEREAMLVATATPAPLFRKAAEQLAALGRLDVVLLRIGDRFDGALRVTADLTLAALPHAPWPMVDLALWTGPAGQLWLVPFGFGASVAATSEGFLLDMVPPYASRRCDRGSAPPRSPGGRSRTRSFSPETFWIAWNRHNGDET